MNPHIQTLLLRATEYQSNGDDTESPVINQEKFAELIAQECIDIVASRPYIDDGNWSHPSTMIKEHFGIEK